MACTIQNKDGDDTLDIAVKKRLNTLELLQGNIAD